jgi:hypothetical protein
VFLIFPMTIIVGIVILHSLILFICKSFMQMRWAGHVACMGEERNVFKVLVGKSEGKRPLGRPRHRWEVGIRMNLRETGWGVWWFGFN